VPVLKVDGKGVRDHRWASTPGSSA
jgi:hypothetical protein